MLTSLHIKNYALIDVLDVSFTDGLCIITGETGAGKSILLGGLALVLGKRADLSQIKDKNEKCIIEASFNIASYNLNAVFQALDLDFEFQTIIRREILPSGKSRAFINDTPVTLDNLSKLSTYLIDIHSQHQTRELTEDEYQLKVIDALASNENDLNEYSSFLKDYKVLQKSLSELKASKIALLKDYDYNLFLKNELGEVDLATIDLETLEAEYETLSNVEVIDEKLSSARAIFSQEQLGTIDQLALVKQELAKISDFSESYRALGERVESVHIELNDIIAEIDNLQDGLLSNPEALQTISSTLQRVNNLFQKHSVNTISELIAIKESLETKVNTTEDLDATIEKHEAELLHIESKLNTLANTIRVNRKNVIPLFTEKLETILSDLGMPNAKFKIELEPTEQFLSHGKDQLNFLFMANKGSSFNALKKSASGGELSRIMLAVKSILAEYIQLPTIMFDEIDTGVSGEISHKMGDIMKAMSKYMQVFTITHLPQIAAKGNTHFKVYKEDVANQTQTQLRVLTEEERIVEIAQMLGGTNITDSALSHAKQLLN